MLRQHQVQRDNTFKHIFHKISWMFHLWETNRPCGKVQHNLVFSLNVNGQLRLSGYCEGKKCQCRLQPSWTEFWPNGPESERWQKCVAWWRTRIETSGRGALNQPEEKHFQNKQTQKSVKDDLNLLLRNIPEGRLLDKAKDLPEISALWGNPSRGLGDSVSPADANWWRHDLCTRWRLAPTRRCCLPWTR